MQKDSFPTKQNPKQQLDIQEEAAIWLKEIGSINRAYRRQNQELNHQENKKSEIESPPKK